MDSLSNELLLNVASELVTEDLCALALVSKHMQPIAQEHLYRAISIPASRPLPAPMNIPDKCTPTAILRAVQVRSGNARAFRTKLVATALNTTPNLVTFDHRYDPSAHQEPANTRPGDGCTLPSLTTLRLDLYCNFTPLEPPPEATSKVQTLEMVISALDFNYDHYFDYFTKLMRLVIHICNWKFEPSHGHRKAHRSDVIDRNDTPDFGEFVDTKLSCLADTLEELEIIYEEDERRKDYIWNFQPADFAAFKKLKTPSTPHPLIQANDDLVPCGFAEENLPSSLNKLKITHVDVREADINLLLKSTASSRAHFTKLAEVHIKPLIIEGTAMLLPRRGIADGVASLKEAGVKVEAQTVDR
ncbi:hypothetical protein EK21DRAFT_113227 [Setomelanomma holmii]|uniref:F-box domain-containing protein n=1 Tax=Setomelanomma holmii TaxID=210430 RepID=A0A9P4H7P2_9PLEO|nr:hypothetical protein EK21DRAFT_113227 [Setomelanomma holmii]